MSRNHVLTREESVTPEQMAAENYVDRLHCEFRTRMIEHFMGQDVVMHPRIRSEREDWVQQLVAAGVGVCSLSERSCIVDGLELRPIKGFDAQRQVTLVAVSGSGTLKEVRQIVKMAQSYDWGKFWAQQVRCVSQCFAKSQTAGHSAWKL